MKHIGLIGATIFMSLHESILQTRATNTEIESDQIESEKPSAIIELNKDTFEDAVRDNPFLFVEFYAPEW